MQTRKPWYQVHQYRLTLFCREANIIASLFIYVPSFHRPEKCVGVQEVNECQYRGFNVTGDPEGAALYIDPVGLSDDRRRAPPWHQCRCLLLCTLLMVWIPAIGYSQYLVEGGVQEDWCPCLGASRSPFHHGL